MTMTRKPPTAQEAVLVALREWIAHGTLRPGQQVVQEDLSAALGVSRVPLREALKILEAEGLVTYYPHRGYFVTELSVADLLEVYRLRDILEAEALQLAVEECSAADVDAIEALLDDLEEATAAGDVGAMTACNRAFHFAMFDAAGRPRLSRLIRQLWDSTDVYRTVYFHDPANRERVTAEHRSMVRALRDRKTDDLVRLQADHRANAVSSVVATIEGNETKS